jgi:glucose dehydrogenase
MVSKKMATLCALLASTIMAAMPSLSTGSVAAAAPKAECASKHHPGGDWPSYGQDLASTRNQYAEKKIDISNAASLSAAWTFSATDEKGFGSFQSTPVIAEGCLYMTTGSGFVYALNADTGKVVWEGRYAKTVEGVCCGSTLFAPTVKDGVAYLNVSRNPETAGRKNGPYAIALDSQTGKLLWKSESVATEKGAYTNSSAVVYRGLLLMGISGPEGGIQNIGGYAILNAANGKIIKRVHTIPDRDRKKGYGGGSIWASAAVDAKKGYAFMGVGQPATWDKEHRYVNAILKVDVNRHRRTFGRIVDAYKATQDGADLNRQAQCQEAGGCGWTDVDFGASPSLLRDKLGRQVVAEYQKSGVLHAAYTDNMQRAWTATLSAVQAPLGNYASTATDGKNVFGVGTYPGQMFSVDGTMGGYQWASPVGSILGANPLAYANGVVYHADGKGFFDAYDSATGAPLVHRPMSADTGSGCSNLGGGVAIARNTVYAVCGESGFQFYIGPGDYATGWVVAYRLPRLDP